LDKPADIELKKDQKAAFGKEGHVGSKKGKSTEEIGMKNQYPLSLQFSSSHLV
jgi:hypothetical protein